MKKMEELARKIVKLKMEYLKLNYGNRFDEKTLGEAIDLWDIIGMSVAQVYLSVLYRTKDPLAAKVAVASLFSNLGRAILAEKFRTLQEVMELEDYFRRKGVKDGGG